MAEVQALIESSKFEPHDLDIGALERKTADAQIVLVLLLTLARHQRDPGLSEEIRARAREIDGAVAKTLEALASRAARIPGSTTPDVDGALATLERCVAGLPEIRAGASAIDEAPWASIGLSPPQSSSSRRSIWHRHERPKAPRPPRPMRRLSGGASSTTRSS